jgi:DNA-binding CsgD family transcriptional regulator
MRHSLHVLKAMIPADDVAWIGFAIARRPKLDTWVALEQVVDRQLLGRMETGLAPHPFTGPFASSPNGSRAMRLSEFPKSVRDKHRTEYVDVYRALDIRDAMMAVIEVGAGGTVAVTLNRKTRDFSERDRLVLTLMQDHLRRARANARLPSDHDGRTSGATSARERFGLTPRECDVAFWLSHGKTNAEIAIILRHACRTAEKHVEAVLRKLKVENRTTAAVVLRRSVGVAPDK